MTTTQLVPAARGRPLDLSEDAFGRLRPSGSLVGNPQALRARLEQDGYRFVRTGAPKRGKIC